MVLCRGKALLLSIAILRALAEESEEDTSELIRRPDAGLRLRLGTLFDMRTDTPISGHLWTKELIEQHTEFTSSAWTYIDAAQSNTIREKQKIMAISADLALHVNLNPGTLGVKTSFGFLDHHKSSSKAIMMSCWYQTRTKNQRLRAFDEEMLKNVNQYVFGKGSCPQGNADSCRRATHVVTEVNYGADVYAVFESHAYNSYDKDRLKIYLNAKLSLPASLDMEFTFDMLNEEELKSIEERTRVTIYGDFRLDREMPTSTDDAIAFMRSLPNQTNTLFGDGVPMEVVLTPLSWFDTDAAKLRRRINEDTIERFLGIYESLDESQAKIVDLVNMRYGGFKAWKLSQDAYFHGFRVFRSEFSLQLSEAMASFKSGMIDQAVLEDLEQKYLESDYEEKRVENSVERRRDELVNLMALVSQFADSHIVFAEQLSEFFAPTFDAMYDRVYALVMVGFNPNADRSGITAIRDFVTLARARLRSDTAEAASSPVKHCVERAAVDNPNTLVCTEKLAFVAIHATSFCQDFCGPEFCQLDPIGDPICPTSSAGDMPPQCWLNAEDADALRCSVSNATGKCGANAEHAITNNDRPYSDCWCACPRTQVVEYYRSTWVSRLTDKMPRVPQPPRNLRITGHDVPELLPLKQTAMLHHEMDPLDGARNYRVTLIWDEPYQEGTVSKFRERQSALETGGRSDVIPLQLLVAGRQYRLELQGISAQGSGLPTVLDGSFLVAHRMATVTFSPVGKRPEYPMHNHGPRWLGCRVLVQLSTKAIFTIEAATLHADAVSGDQISKLTPEESGEPLLRCRDIEQDSLSTETIICHMAFDTFDAGEDTTFQLRVWDVGGLLAAVSSVTLLPPSATACSRWGNSNYFCALLGQCVTSCTSQCGLGMIPQFGECLAASCAAGKIWCPRHEECLNSTADPEEVCATQCRDGHGQNAVGAVAADLGSEQTCVNRCNVMLGGHLTSGLVARGKNLTIQCEDPAWMSRGVPMTFTCPAVENVTKDDLSFVFDEEAVLKHVAEPGPLPVCKLCPADQTYDEQRGVCRFQRGVGAGWNYVINGDFERAMLTDGLPSSPWAVLGSPSQADHFTRKEPGAGGSSASLLLHGIGLRQTLRVQLLAAGSAPPPLGSTWRASVFYRVLDTITDFSLLCLRDRDAAQPECVQLRPALQGIADTQWLHAEVRMVAGDGATLLAVEVYAGNINLDQATAKVRIDRLAVEKVSDNDTDVSFSPMDVVSTGWAPFKGMVAHFRSACPEGWIPNPEADGRVIKGLAEDQSTSAGAVVGDPLGHEERKKIVEVPQHRHYVSNTDTNAHSHNHGYQDNSGWSTCFTPGHVDCHGSEESGNRYDTYRYTSSDTHSHTVNAHYTQYAGKEEGVDVTMPYVEYVSCIFVGA